MKAKDITGETPIHIFGLCTLSYKYIKDKVKGFLNHCSELLAEGKYDTAHLYLYRNGAAQAYLETIKLIEEKMEEDEEVDTEEICGEETVVNLANTWGSLRDDKLRNIKLVKR